MIFDGLITTTTLLGLGFIAVATIIAFCQLIIIAALILSYIQDRRDRGRPTLNGHVAEPVATMLAGEIVREAERILQKEAQ